MARILRTVREARKARIWQLLLTQVTRGPVPPMQRGTEETEEDARSIMALRGLTPMPPRGWPRSQTPCRNLTSQVRSTSYSRSLNFPTRPL